MDYLLQARAERARQPGNAHAAVEGRACRTGALH